MRSAARRDKLARIAAQSEETVYLRVVSRVYLTGGVTVSLANTGAIGGRADAGAPKGLDLLSVRNKSTAKAYEDVKEALGAIVNPDLPGGTIGFSQVTSRGVTLHERFNRLLAVGYLGFDVPVKENGRLGAPVATLSQLTAQVKRRVVVGELTESQRALNVRYTWLKDLIAEGGHERRRALCILASAVGRVRASAFDDLNRDAYGALCPRDPEADPPVSGEAALDYLMNFWNAVDVYTSADLGEGERYDRTIRLIDEVAEEAE
jgi:hypothetical protein